MKQYQWIVVVVAMSTSALSAFPVSAEASTGARGNEAVLQALHQRDLPAATSALETLNQVVDGLHLRPHLFETAGEDIDARLGPLLLQAPKQRVKQQAVAHTADNNNQNSLPAVIGNWIEAFFDDPKGQAQTQQQPQRNRTQIGLGSGHANLSFSIDNRSRKRCFKNLYQIF